MSFFQPKTFKITLTNGETINVKCQSVELKNTISKIDLTIPYEYMMFVNEKIKYIFSSAFDMTKTYMKDNTSQELYNLKILDMQQVYLEYLDLKSKNQDYQKEINELQKQHQETSNQYQDQLRQNQILQQKLNEKNNQIQELENYNQQSQVTNKNVDEKLQEKNKELRDKEDIINQLNDELSYLKLKCQHDIDFQKQKENEWKNKYSELESQLQEEKKQLISSQNFSNQLQQESEQLKNDFNAYQQQYNLYYYQLQAQLSAYCQAYTELKEETENCQKIIEEKDLKIKEKQKETKIIKDDNESLQTQMEQDKQNFLLEKTKLEKEKDNLKKEINELKYQNQQQQQYIQELNKQLEQEQTKISDLKKQLKEFKSQEIQQFQQQQSQSNTILTGMPIINCLKKQ